MFFMCCKIVYPTFITLDRQSNEMVLPQEGSKISSESVGWCIHLFSPDEIILFLDAL